MRRDVTRRRGRIDVRNTHDEPVSHDTTALCQAERAIRDGRLVDLELCQAPCVRRDGSHPRVEQSAMKSIPLLKVLRIERHAFRPHHSAWSAHEPPKL